MCCSPEIRRPKAETRKRAEIRIPSMACFDWLLLRRGGYQFGPRSSGLGFGMARTDFRTALAHAAACRWAGTKRQLIRLDCRKALLQLAYHPLQVRLAVVICAQLPNRADQPAQEVHMLGQLGQHRLHGQSAGIPATTAETESDDPDARSLAVPCFVRKPGRVTDKHGITQQSLEPRHLERFREMNIEICLKKVAPRAAISGDATEIRIVPDFNSRVLETPNQEYKGHGRLTRPFLGNLRLPNGGRWVWNQLGAGEHAQDARPNAFFDPTGEFVPASGIAD